MLGADSIERTLTTFATELRNLKTVIRIADHNVFGNFFPMSQQIQLNAQSITLDITDASDPLICVDAFPLLKALKEAPTRTLNAEYPIFPWPEIQKEDPKDYADAKALLECAAKTHSDLLHSLAALPTSCTAQEVVTILRQIRHKDLDQSSRPSKNYGRGKEHGEGMMDELHPSGDPAR